jgi:hypothetical protein
MPSGDRFGRWLVLGDGPPLKGFPTYRCRCDCGTERSVVVYSLYAGRSRSCGCLSRDTSSHIHRTHARTKTPEYKAWLQIKQRCLNPNNPRFTDYGGRGIQFLGECCQQFEAFFAFVGERPSPQHTIERPNNDGPYCGPCPEFPHGNMRWATRIEQQNNKRSNHRVTYQGLTLTLTQWVRRLGLPRDPIKRRLQLGWSFHDAVTLPIVPGQKTKALRSRS